MVRHGISSDFTSRQRSGDVRALKVQDIDFSANRIAFTAAKSGRVERRPMMPAEGELLEAWIPHAHGENPDPEAYVFRNPRNGEQFARGHDWKLDAVLERAGIKKNGRKLHAFRHAGAVAAASGVWGDPWSKDEVGCLLRDTSDAVSIYFLILDEHLVTKAANAKQALTFSTTCVDALTLKTQVHRD